MVTEKIRQLEATKAKVAALEKTIEGELSRELASLPSEYGFDSVSAFVKAVAAAVGSSGKAGKRRGRPPKAAKAKIKAEKKAVKAAKAGKSARRKRSVITDDTRASVKKLAEEGKTGAEIAAALDISIPTVQNIKKALGLVKARTAAASA